MKYFTKYIPVEGEIKEGDAFPYGDGKLLGYATFLNKCGDGTICEVIAKDRKTTKHLYFNIPKPHKLFLCSREIRIGDKVYPDPIKHFYRNGAAVCDLAEKHDIHIYKEEGFFKVIGEVSPEAIWVKEGMEFDEEDVQFWHGDHKDYGFIIDPKISSNWLQWVNRPIKIKCSQCNTFH